jgi:hypothetical protein
MSELDEPLPAPGWDAIDEAVGAHYGDQTPHQFTSKRAYDLDGASPLPAITVWECENPDGWHFVTYGLSELFEKSSPDPKLSGFGYELTLRTTREGDAGSSEAHPPTWPLRMLQALGKHILESRADYDAGQLLNLGAKMVPGRQSELRGVACIPDPVLGKIPTPHGSVLFLRLIGLTEDELEMLRPLELPALVSALAELEPLGLTTPGRESWVQHPQKSKILRRVRMGIRL